ncbi:hypothetical protein [Pseudobacteriovorax antillogorgiicola]|nr:hypothetical protein [Pseudobacteriovorax antillogorgiicola]
MEAKFNEDPNDLDISASPLASKITKRVVEALVEYDTQMKGESARERWINWLMISPKRREWAIAEKYAQKDRQFKSLNKGEKIQFVRDLFSPFEIQEEQVEHFIQSIVNY